MSFNIQVLEPNFKETLSGFQSLENYEERPKLLSEVVRCELMNLRTSNAHTKTRAEVSGGGKKPWKQKGTGRARHGSTRSPIWVGGGVAFGPRNTRNWSKKINKSAHLAALKTIIKNRLEGNAIFQFVTNFDYPKTKGASEILETLTQKTEVKTKSTLVIYTQEDKEKLNGFPNTEAKMIDAANLKIHRLVNATNLIFTPAARDFLEKRLAENVTGEGAQKITPKKEVKAVEEKAAKAEKAVKKAPAKAVKTPETETKPKKAASVEKSEKAEKSETPKKKATSKAKEE